MSMTLRSGRRTRSYSTAFGSPAYRSGGFSTMRRLLPGAMRAISGYTMRNSSNFQRSSAGDLGVSNSRAPDSTGVLHTDHNLSTIYRKRRVSRRKRRFAKKKQNRWRYQFARLQPSQTSSAQAVIDRR